MNPAPSVIGFTVLSGLGFGLLALLALGFGTGASGASASGGWPAFFHWGLGYGLAVGGLLSSTLHLGNPRRALWAFTQWRTSWLSREGWAAVATLVALAPVAMSDWLALVWPVGVLALVGAVLCAATILCTSMIYAQMKTVPRWNHWTTPVLFFAFAIAGGGILVGSGAIALAGLVALGLSLGLNFVLGDGRFAAVGQTIATATGLGRIGSPSVFEQPHTGGNYLLREMIHVVGRKHARTLRFLAVELAVVAPAVLLIISRAPWAFVVAAVLHLTGAVIARWLFFAQAEHVVGLYYGARQTPV